MTKVRTTDRRWHVLAAGLASMWALGACGGGATPPEPAPDAGADAVADGPSDTTPPRLLSSDPEDGATDVSTMLDSIDLTFDEVLDLYGLADVDRTVRAEGRDIEVWLEPADGGRTLKLHPFGPLPEYATVTVQIGAGLTDQAGNATSEPVTIAFRTGVAALVAQPSRIAGPPGHSETPVLLAGSPLEPLPASDAAWTSDDESVATVADDGTVTLAAAGSTTVRARLGGQEAAIEVVVAEAASGGLPPGQDPSFKVCNEMDLENDGRLRDGGCDRFDDHWVLSVGGIPYQPPLSDPADPTSPRRAPEFLAPYEGPAPVLVGDHLDAPNRCVLLSHGEATAAQTVDLSGLASARLIFFADARTEGPDPDGTPPGWQFVLRDAAGTESTLVDETLAEFDSRSGRYDLDLTPWVGGPVELVWRLSGAPRSELEILEPSVQDQDGAEHFAEADCSTLDAWRFPRVLLPRRIRFPESELDGQPGIFVWRDLYVPYENPYWVRYLDVVENRSSDTVTVEVALEYDVGPTEPTWFPMHDGEVVVELDGDGDDPGVAMLLGRGFTADFEHDNDDGPITWTVTLEPGERARLLTYNVYFYDDEHANPEDFARLEALYESLRAGVGPAMAGLSREDWEQALNWRAPSP